MPFKDIESRPRGLFGGVAITGVAPGKGHVIGGVRLRLGEDICDHLGIKVGGRVSLALGYGKDHGTLRLTRDGPFSYKLALAGGGTHKRGGVISLTRLGDRQKHCQEPIPHKLRNGAVIVTLPDWARPAS